MGKGSKGKGSMADGFVVAVDGPAASGKGTLSKRLAEHFKLAHLDTGLLYRAVGAAMVEAYANLDDGALAADFAKNLDLTDLNADHLAQHHIGEAASKIAVYQPVREALLHAQQAFAQQAGGAVLDGRDIGTVVCPDAQAKLFVTASLEARAGRRYAQAVVQNPSITLEAVRSDLAKRDARDESRTNAPLAEAKDALLLDTTKMRIDAAFEQARDFVASKMPV